MYECDFLIAGAAMIGGISYFHEFEYDLLSENEQIISTTDTAIEVYKEKNKLKRTVFLSSSMVFESTDVYPTKESDLKVIPPPFSSYGFQKLAVEYFAKAAHSQYGLEYSIARPFNAVGIGEVKTDTSKELSKNSQNLALSHVVPDLILKCLDYQDELEILGEGKEQTIINSEFVSSIEKLNQLYLKKKRRIRKIQRFKKKIKYITFRVFKKIF